ncbi:hypothetical protein BDV98DRAFT_573190 [Pterulicium gracile]|uniref:Nitrate reductase [NADPH] n=1 Tax=Pterulicium gracile TaxID=1884261 RepID=A0A5C3QCK5_9AGAR|nr:hypothetical protein BDV98DRAFT_573190 [Pterula gracilis]
MVRLTGKHPFNAEVSVNSLFDGGFLTPAELFYTRSHGAVPKIEGEVLKNWKLNFTGMVEKDISFTLEQLKTQFETVSLPITLVCAGNRRREQNVKEKGLGFNWGPAGVSTALFTGVYLADILKVAKPKKVNGVRPLHVIFEGYDFDLPQGPYGTSQRLSWASDRKHGILIAWAMNGIPLEPDHGFPLRVVCPGMVGGRSVKWLHKIEVADHESTHHLHIYDNKVLPTQVGPEQARAETHWWYNPKYTIQELNVNSAICKPGHDETVPISTTPSYTFRGYAYAGGGRRIHRVEVSLDEGATWTLAEIEYPEDKFRELAFNDATFGTIDMTERDECFCWCFWNFEIPMDRLKDSACIAVRAMDESLAFQQRDMYWNATGMMNNWWFRVAVHVEGDNIRFEHPTIPGNTPGGWMQRMKDEGKDFLNPKFGAQPDVGAVVPIAAPKVTNGISMVKEGVDRIITLAELKAHNKAEQPWFVVEGEVYDGTGFLAEHPGGGDSIIIVAGEDATEDFMAIHSPDGQIKLRQFHIGTLEGAKTASGAATLQQALAPPESAENADGSFLMKNKWKSMKLTAISKVNHNSSIYRFALDREDQELGLPCGQHVFIRMRRKPRLATLVEGSDSIYCTPYEGGDLVQRAYTPVTVPGTTGHIDFLVKFYLPSEREPTGGKMTCAIHDLKVGDSMEMKGPLGEFIWAGKGYAMWKNVRVKVKNVGMIAAGSGITPILQTLRGIFMDNEDKSTRVWVLDANRTEEDILCRKELEKFLFNSKGRMRLHYTLSPAVVRHSRLHRAVRRVSSRFLANDSGDNWQYSRGHIDAPMMRKHLPPPGPDSLILICGPDGLIHNTAKPGLTQLGWDVEKQLVVF